jgi:hypothetical protein
MLARPIADYTYQPPLSLRRRKALHGSSCPSQNSNDEDVGILSAEGAARVIPWQTLRATKNCFVTEPNTPSPVRARVRPYRSQFLDFTPQRLAASKRTSSFRPYRKTPCARDSGRHHGERAVQRRDRNRRAWLFSADQVNRTQRQGSYYGSKHKLS